MSSDLQLFLERLVSRVLSERPPGFDPWFFDYFRELATPAGCRRYARALEADLALARFDPAGGTVVDAGSGFGVTLLCLARLGARPAIGIEAFRPMAATAVRLRNTMAPDLPAVVIRGSVHETPLPDRSVDFIYCNEALSHFRKPVAFLDEAARILRRGGRLMICDGNNALNPRTRARVLEIWRRFEEGPPADDLFGHRIETPYRERRRAKLEAAFPDQVPATVEKLAWGTFGLSGEEILARAREMLSAGNLPAGPVMVNRSPVDPDKGDFIENLVDASALREELERRGFSVKVHAHFGGARGPAVALANRVLRAFTPMTITYARSVKIVARLEVS